MATVTITISDKEDGKGARVRVGFDPEIRPDADPTPAQRLAMIMVGRSNPKALKITGADHAGNELSAVVDAENYEDDEEADDEY